MELPDRIFGIARIGARLMCVMLAVAVQTHAQDGTEAPAIVDRSPDRIVRAGSDVWLQATVIGAAPISYQWEFQGATLQHSLVPAYQLRDVQPQHSGIYTLTVSNLHGMAATHFSLIVTDAPPEIVRQPTRLPNQQTKSHFVALLGSAIDWSVDARGSHPLAYQWRVNGIDLPGATNAVLSLTNLLSTQSGFYSVAVSNAMGTALSAKLSLEVAPLRVFGVQQATNAPPGLGRIQRLAATDTAAAALHGDGRVAAWGTMVGSAVTNVPSTATNVISIAAGMQAMFALRENGTVAAWGSGFMTNVPATASNLLSISTASRHALGVRNDGKVITWGTGPGVMLPSSVASNVIAVSAGLSPNLALTSEGRVIAWGDGAATNIPSHATNIIAIEAGSRHSLALRADGTVVAWGSSVSSETAVPAAATNVVAIQAGAGSSAALRADGTLVYWGTPRILPPHPIQAVLSNVVTMALSDHNPFMIVVFGDGSPVITLDPSSQRMVPGRMVRLHARAAGRLPMKFQWQRNGIEIPGATNWTLELPNRSSSAGEYSMVARNDLGVATSRPARVGLPAFAGSLASALDATDAIWQTFSRSNRTNGGWFPQAIVSLDHTGAAQSLPISDGDQASLLTIVPGPGTLTFWWKVSSEPGYDTLSFRLNNAPLPLMSISGEVKWQRQTVRIPAGSHVLRWDYTKDGSVSVGRDAAWVGSVTFRQSVPFRLIPIWGNAVPEIGLAVRDLEGKAIPGLELVNYSVEVSSNLMDWAALPVSLTLTNGVILFQDSKAFIESERFYRLRED